MKKIEKRFYRKNVELFDLINKIKLWPSKSGNLHGIKTIVYRGEYAMLETHCGEKILIKNSRNSRAARWLKNKWYTQPCKRCKIPQWKLDKYGTVMFSDHYGKRLNYNIKREGGENE